MPSFFNSVGSIQSAIQHQIARSAAFIATNNVGGNMALIDWSYTASGRTPG
jgi:hypothetical protein